MSPPSWLTRCSDGFIKMTIGRDPELVVPFVNAVLLAGTIEGEIHVAEDANGTIVGGAVWFGPGSEFCHRLVVVWVAGLLASCRQTRRLILSSEAQQERVLVPLLAQFDDELQTWWNDKVSRSFITTAPPPLLRLASVLTDDCWLVSTRVPRCYRSRARPQQTTKILSPTAHRRRS
jgi:hypothetical protein